MALIAPRSVKLVNFKATQIIDILPNLIASLPDLVVAERSIAQSQHEKLRIASRSIKTKTQFDFRLHTQFVLNNDYSFMPVELDF